MKWSLSTYGNESQEAQKSLVAGLSDIARQLINGPLRDAGNFDCYCNKRQ